ESEIAARSFFLWPRDAVLDSYRYIFSTGTFVRSLVVTVCVTTVGMAIHVLLTFTMAYPLSKRHLPGRNLVLSLVVVTMVFSAGLIPTYLIVRNLGLLNTYWALLFPLAITPFFLVIVKTFFQELPQELQEAAMIDGCSELGV